MESSSAFCSNPSVHVYSAGETGISLENVMNENFTKLVESVFGSRVGDVNSPVWLCGLEQNRVYCPETLILESDLQPHNIKDPDTTSDEDFIDSFRRATSQINFCPATIKIVFELRKCINPEEMSETREKLESVGAGRLAFVLNAFPIPFENRDVAAAKWNEYKVRTEDDGRNSIPLRDWTGLNSFGEYEDFVVKHRSKLYSTERKLHKPKLIICFGKQSFDYFLKLWNVEGKDPALKFNFDEPFNPDFESKSYPNCFAYWADETLVAVVPFPKWPSRQISSEQIKNIITWLSNEVSRKYGPNWLDIQSSAVPDEASGTSMEDAVLWEIGEFQELVNQQLSCLERLEDLTAKLPNSWYSSKDGQKKLAFLKETLLRDYLHEFDELGEELETKQDKKRKEFLKRFADKGLSDKF